MLSCDDLRELTGVWAAKMRAAVPGVEQIPFEPKEVVSLCLSTMAGEYGMEEANKTIDEFNLEELGFNKKEVK